MNLKAIKIIAIVLVSIIALGCVESQPSPPTSIENPKSTIVSTPNPTPVKTSILIIASPSQMLPTINDMPDGTRKLEDTGNDTYAQKKFAIISSSASNLLIKYLFTIWIASALSAPCLFIVYPVFAM